MSIPFAHTLTPDDKLQGPKLLTFISQGNPGSDVIWTWAGRGPDKMNVAIPPGVAVSFYLPAGHTLAFRGAPVLLVSGVDLPNQ